MYEKKTIIIVYNCLKLDSKTNIIMVPDKKIEYMKKENIYFIR